MYHYIKFHRSYSVYFGSWGSLPYTNDEYGNPVIYSPETMTQAVWFFMNE